MKVKSTSKVGAALHRTKICLLLITVMLFNQVSILPANATITTQNEISDVITTEVGGEEIILNNPEPIKEEIVAEEKMEVKRVVEEPRVIMKSVDLSSRSGGLQREPIVTNIVYQPEPEPEPVVEEIIEVDLDPYANASNVTEPSNATASELNRAINSSCKWMKAYNTNGQLGELYYKMEQQYGINAYFAISVSMQEVGPQKASNLANTKNNIYGLKGKNGWMSFNSYEDCIQYWFKLISKNYVGKGLSSVNKISNKYCGGDPTWIKNVSNFMYKLPNASV